MPEEPWKAAEVLGCSPASGTLPMGRIDNIYTLHNKKICLSIY
jgi:hypothetical protein